MRWTPFLPIPKLQLLNPTFKSNAASERFYGITCSSIPLGVSFLYPLISDCMLVFVCEHVQHTWTSCFCAHDLKQNSVCAYKDETPRVSSGSKIVLPRSEFSQALRYFARVLWSINSPSCVFLMSFYFMWCIWRHKKVTVSNRVLICIKGNVVKSFCR